MPRGGGALPQKEKTNRKQELARVWRNWNPRALMLGCDVVPLVWKRV